MPSNVAVARRQCRDWHLKRLPFWRTDHTTPIRSKLAGSISPLLNHRNQAHPYLAAQFIHPNVSGTVLVVTHPSDHPRRTTNKNG
ncbi:hypothetical protein BDA96_10G025500 [Sorghum bicolor]|uniref:Uncharacterized protein n=1 Tax=Sorghum bicolor TaxID=4558 RepID=A0A921PY51_SORBI|nr:hypothetical protein BDA96_10G025500 [Sorghum bicolor]